MDTLGPSVVNVGSSDKQSFFKCMEVLGNPLLLFLLFNGPLLLGSVNSST